MVQPERTSSSLNFRALFARWWSTLRPSRSPRKVPSPSVRSARPAKVAGFSETSSAAAMALSSLALGEEGNRFGRTSCTPGNQAGAPADAEDALTVREEEIRRLESRVEELSARLSIAGERLEVLATYQEAVRNLRDKNSLLTAKAEQQARWLKSLSAGNSENEELSASLSRLSDENRQLRAELLTHFNLFGRVKDHLPPEVRPTIEELIKRKQQLFANLENKDELLQNAADPSRLSLMDHMEILTEQNHQLKSMMNSKQSIEGFLRSPEQATTPEAAHRIITALRRENQRLEQALQERDAQVESISKSSETRQLLTAYSNLQERYQQVFKENQAGDQLNRLQQREKQFLAAQTREKSSLIRENQKLKSEFASALRTLKGLKNYQARFQTLQKEHEELAADHAQVKAELGTAGERLKEVTTEYDMMIDKYERLFEKS